MRMYRCGIFYDQELYYEPLQQKVRTDTVIKLIAADMDGTLVDSSQHLPPDLHQVVRGLTQRGVRFAVASGRQYYNLLKHFEPIHNEMTFIAENGGVIFEKGKLLYCNEIVPERLEILIQTLESIPGIKPVLAGVKSSYIIHGGSVFIENLYSNYERYETVKDLREVTQYDTICKIAVFDESGAEKHSLPQLKSLEKYGFTVLLSQPCWMDIQNQEVDKGIAIQELQRMFGIQPDECMAFGDYLNDRGMMKVVDYSYAMANAHPELKAVSRYVAKSNDENGVIDKIREFFPDL